ncbi:MAG: HAD family hydrolase, partial [Dehalococcoidia bacterium]
GILWNSLARCRRRWPNVSNASDIIYVGDHPVDALAAQSCGVHFIGMATRPHRLCRLRQVVAGDIHEDYADLGRFFSHVDQLWEQ